MVLGIAGGGVLAGIIGALLAVPTVAFLNTAARVLVAGNPDVEAASQEADSDPAIKAKADDLDRDEG